MTQGRRALDLAGRRFGKLVAVERVGTGARQKSALWMCECDCGASVPVSAAHLVKTPDRDCGCGAKTISSTVPNATSHPLYACWSSMWTRCTWDGHKDWLRYGGRGIQVCDRWRDFGAFLSDIAPRPSRAHSIDRIDCDGHYEPTNVRWATAVEQNRNRSTTLLVLVGETWLHVAEAAVVLGIKEHSVRKRISSGALKAKKKLPFAAASNPSPLAPLSERPVRDATVRP